MKTKIILTVCLLLLISAAGCQSVPSVKTPDLPPPSPLPPPTLSPDSRLVAIYFDDGFRNQYLEALPVLLKFGFRATFGIITDSIGEGRELMEYMDEKELKTLARYGMEIASHTREHTNLAGELSDKQLRREIFDSKRDLEKMGFTVNTMVYPYYEDNDKVIEHTLEAGYTCGRAGWSEERVYDLTTNDPIDRYHICAWQISNQGMDHFKLVVEQASRTKVVSLVYHIISYTGPEVTSTTVADFYEQMSYLSRNGFTVVFLSELLKQ